MIVVDVRDMSPEQWRLGVETRMLVSARSGAVQLCIFEQWIAPGAGAPTHSHPVEEVLTVRRRGRDVDGRTAPDRLFRPVADRAGRSHARLPHFGTTTLHIHAVLASPIFEAEGETVMTRRWGTA